MKNDIPLSLYVHVPWCIKKCPYCDFNSHAKKDTLPEEAYITQLLNDFKYQLPHIENRSLKSIFIGGGTPSLFSPEIYKELFNSLKKYIDIPNNIEITLEANPGTLIPNRFEGYLDSGINRLSIGVQSFQTDKLKNLGRIHNSEQAIEAIKSVKNSGFENFNIDLMFGLPNQKIDDALFDLQTAIDLNPTHISWYQLTLEPNTVFYKFPPKLPADDYIFEMQKAGKQLLAKNNFNQYEISAFSKTNKECQHNINYWQFGDYIGIGAGAHGKITDFNSNQICRISRVKIPRKYLEAKSNEELTDSSYMISKSELPLEFMMNAMRLHQPISFEIFSQRTGLSIDKTLKKLSVFDKDLVFIKNESIELTEKGRLFLNDILEAI